MSCTGSENTAQPPQTTHTMEVIANSLAGDVVGIDLVFVHGITDNWQDTWSNGERSWIRDFVPKEIPHARIMTFGYNSQLFMQENESISNVADILIQNLERNRDNEKRPLVFVAHSLGGLLVKASLQTCSYHLRDSVMGVMFFGTPSFGIDKKAWTDFAAALSHIDRGFGNRSETYVLGDEYASQLGSINKRFENWLPHEKFARKVICFYELSPIVDDITVVKKESAVLPHCDTTGLYANHVTMTKFLPDSGNSYQVVIQSLRSMYCLAKDSMRVLLRHSLAPDSHGRLRNLSTTPDWCEEFIVSTEGSSEARNVGRLALILQDQGHYKKAEEKFQSAIDLFREQQSSGAESKAMLFCLNKLGSLLRNRGLYKDAEMGSRRCLDSRISISGKGSVPTLLAADNLALSLKCQGKLGDAYNLLRDALENTDPFMPNEVAHVKLLDTLAKLTQEYELNDISDSLSCDVVRISICLYGDKHPFTLNRMSDLAVVLAGTGHMPGAEAMSRHALDALEQTLGNDHPYCLRAARKLADYMRYQQRYGEASLRLKRILRTQRMRLGDYHPDTLSTMRSLAAVYALRGYLKDAEALLDQALGYQRQCFELESRHTSWTLKALNGLRELKNGRILVDGEAQQGLFELFGPKLRSTSPNRLPRCIYNSSDFQTSTEAEVIRTIANGDQNRLSKILNEGEVSTEFLGRALREAAASSQEACVRLLLDRDAPINGRSGFHGTALQAAAFAGNEVIVELLLARKANVNLTGGIFGNALKAAILGRHTSIVHLLLHSVRTGELSQDILTSSMQAALRAGDFHVIGHLLYAGADIDARDNLFGSPLQQVSFFGQEELMTILLERKANTQIQGGIFGSPLEAAIRTKNKSGITQLLKVESSHPSVHDTPKNSILDLLRSGYEEGLTEIILGRLTDSLQFTPLPNRVGSGNYPQSAPRSVMYPLKSIPPRVRGSPQSEDLVLNQRGFEVGPSPTPSAFTRIFSSKITSDEKNSINSGSRNKAFKRRSKRALQLFK